MNQQPAGPPGAQVRQTRVYYNPATGEVLHVHQLVSAPSEPLSPDRVDAEMNAFGHALRQRWADLDHLIVGADDLLAFGDRIVVDVRQKKLAQRPDN